MSSLLCLALVAQAATPEPPSLLAPFAWLPLPTCAGRTLVEFNTGGYSRSDGAEQLEFQYVIGWVLRQDATHIVLWDADLVITPYSRRVEFPPNWERSRADHPAGRPLPGEMREVDFANVCRAANEGRTTTEWTFNRPGLPTAVLAWWAHQRGEPKARDALLETTSAYYRRAGPAPVVEQLRAELAVNARWRTTTDANQGRSRTELLAAWQAIARLAPDARDNEAGRMTDAYQSLLAEDASSTEPTDAGLLTLPATTRVEVWLHRLRDLAALQCSQPGGCYVFMGFGNGATRAAEALRDLGWTAVPGLIGRLDDVRPTRSLGFWRDFAPDSYHLLTHGDCSRQILRAITGESFGDRAAGERWWKAHADQGADPFFLGKLARGENVRFAAERLLERDAETHLPAVLEALGAADPEQRAELAHAFAPHAQTVHVPLLESLLALEDPWAEVAVAQALARLGTPARGVERLAVRIESAVTAKASESAYWLNPAVALVVAHDRARAEDVVRALLGSRALQVRMRAFEVVQHVPTPSVLGALVAMLDDRTPTGWSSYFEIRVCDAAADALSAALGEGERFRLADAPEQRDATIAALREYWTKR